MAIDLQKQQVLERGTVVTLHHNSFLLGAGYEYPEPGKEINLDLSAFFLDESGHTPSAGHFIFYGSPHSPDESIECFDDIKGQEHEKILGTP